MMSAINPLPSSESGADKKAYEPSMEEILASIRRIIADDQSLPVRTPREPEPTTPVRTQQDVPQPIRSNETVSTMASSIAPVMPPADAQTEPTAAAAAAAPMEREPAVAHGAISAPQFAMPDGPVAEEPARTHPAFRAVPTVQETLARETPARETLVPEKPARDVEPPPRAEPTAGADPESDEAPPEWTPPRPPSSERTALFSAATDSAVSSAFNMLAASRLADNSDELMTLAREMIRPLLRSWIDENMPGMVERMVRAEIERVARGGR